MTTRARFPLAAALVAGLGLLAAPAQQSPASAGTDRWATAATISHVIVIPEENHAYSTIIGSSQAPYLNALARSYGLATSYTAISHPSLPNYLALTSGSTYGITDDLPPASHRISAPSIFSQTSWKVFAESEPRPCDPNSTDGLYAVRHAPAPYYTNLGAACTANDTSTAGLPTALSNGLPAYTMITPNLNDDMHSGTVSQGDAWLKANLPKIMAGKDYKAGTAVVLIVWDEGSSTDNHVPLLVVSPSTHAHSSLSFNHYSLLGMIERLLHVPVLASAATAPVMSLSNF